MFKAHLVERADDRTLEQRPDTLDSVGVHVAHNPLPLRVVYRLMERVVIGNPQVRLEIVRRWRLRL